MRAVTAPMQRHRLWPTGADIALAALAVLFLGSSLHATWRGDLGAALLALQEALIGMLAVVRRRPVRAAPAYSRAGAVAWAGTMLPLILRPGLAIDGLLRYIGLTMQILGGMLVLAATLWLGRRFGLIAADRGLQTRGPYRLVRHPLYAAYLLVFGGFVVAHPSLSNGLVCLLWLAVQVQRMRVEEAWLSADSAYLVYQARVPWRLIPWIW